MRTTRPLAWFGGLVLFALPVASAQDMTGSYDLRGRTNRRTTKADLTFERTANGLKVTRTARFTARRYRNVPAFTWTSDDVVQHGDRAWVIYKLNSSGGISGALTGGSGATRYRFLGSYRLEHGKLKEFLYNYTKEGAHDFWRTARLEGLKVSDLASKARARASSLADYVMEYRTDIVDYYEPGDEDRYRRDSRAARRFFREASYVDAPVPTGITAARAVKAVGDDPTDVVEGDVFVLFNADGSVKGRAYVVEGTVYDGDFDDVNPTPTPTPPPPPPPNCSNPVSDAVILQKAGQQRSSLVGFIMDFRTDIADYYEPGDQAYYNADRRSARTYFNGATMTIVPAPPTGYSAHRTVKVSNADPDDVILGTIYLLFDCDGKLKDTVYDHEGEIYDSNDM